MIVEADIPETPPDLAPLKLVTMTVKANLNQYINLDVIARYMKLDDQILSIKYRDIKRGVSKKKHKHKQEKEYDSKRFKNQCTFDIDIGDKVVNAKLFNNGKMVNVGCKEASHALCTIQILRDKIIGMDGFVTYDIPTNFKGKSLKKFFKDDLRKKFGDLLQLLVCYLDLSMDLEPFDKSKTAEDSYHIFLELTNSVDDYTSDIMYVYTIINILKCYYSEDTLLDHFDDPEFQYMLLLITENSDRDRNVIECVFPSYLNNTESISFDHESVDTVLINKSTNCGYYINRTALKEILVDYPKVTGCTYDKSKYPGVVIKYETWNRDIKIIVFNTGKINITAARTHEQVDEAYKFICQICKYHFADLLLNSEYTNKVKEYENSLPVRHYVGKINDQQYYLLNRKHILSNPRNVRLLHKLNLIETYKIK